LIIKYNFKNLIQIWKYGILLKIGGNFENNV
jgi:hypothetical protein